jgi:HAD superfamily hydrolase (TIGR01509 family)
VTRRPPDPPAAVVFDCDGLLLDTESAWSRAEAELYRAHGVTFTLDHKRELLGKAGSTASAVVERHLGAPGHGPALMDELAELVLAEVAVSAPPRPGAAELVAELRARGTPLGLASNSPRAIVESALHVAGFDGVFASVLTAQDVPRPKPAPDVYAESCRRLGAPPERSVALEDSPTGVASAVAAGLYVIGVPSLEGVALDAAHRQAASLADRAVLDALALRLAA